MSDSPSLSFGHHVIPLLSLPGMAGGMGGKAHLAAVKATCKLAARIHGVLSMVGRFELAVLTDHPDFFDPAPGMAKARNLAWDTIRTTRHLQWVILTRHPEHIAACLPQTWIGKGFQNVCIGYIADTDADFPEKLEALRKAPVRYRMIHLSPSGSPMDLCGQLCDIDWVVFAGKPDDTSHVLEIEAACSEANVALMFHQPDGDLESGAANDGQNGESPCPTHPFGTMIDLSRLTLPDLTALSTGMSAQPVSTAHAEQKSGAIRAAVPNTVDHSSDLTPRNPSATADTPDALLENDVVAHAPEVVTADVAAWEAVHAPPIMGKDADEEFHRLDQIVRRGLATFIEVGHALAEIRDGQLWLAGGYANWAAYCQMVGGLTKTHANRLINSAEIAERLVPVAPFGVTPTTESQMRALCKLKPEQQPHAWIRAAERAKGQPTARLISEVVAELMSDEAPPSRTSLSRRNKIISLLSGLRSAVKENLSAEALEGLITELEQCLNVTAGEISR